MKHSFSFLLCIALLLCSAGTLAAQETTRILFVFDASNSMNGFWEGQPKINTATRLLGESLEELYGLENIELGLRVYGHQTKHIPGQQDCDDTELVVPIASGNNLVIKKALERITPQGTTPIARSLEKSAEDFIDTSGRNIIILITDGIEACDEDPCAVSRALQSKNIIVKPFIIGIGLDDKYKSTFECVGNYFDATNEETFELVLDIVLTQALNNTTAQVNLNNLAGIPNETDLPISFYDANTGELKYHYVHTLNTKGNPDTLTLDPLTTYRVVAHSWPPVTNESVKIQPGQHNTISLETPQGYLSVEMSSLRSEYRELKCRVSPASGCSLVNTQEINSKLKYLVGFYNVEIQTTPVTRLTNVEITQDQTTTLSLPSPGSVLLQTGGSGNGGLFVKDGNEWIQVIRFDEGNPSKKYTLQPGNYKVIFRSRNARSTIYTLEKEFKITSGSTTNISLN